jgi:hypothetical protein
MREKSKAEAEAARAEARVLKAEAKAQAEQAALEHKQAARAAAEASRLKQNEEEAKHAHLKLEERVQQIAAAMEALELVLVQAGGGRDGSSAGDTTTETAADGDIGTDRRLSVAEEEPAAVSSAWEELERSLTGSNAAEAAEHAVILAAQTKLVE